MATPSEIADVRANVDEPTEDPWGDQKIGSLIDEAGINGASAIIWRRKAATLAKLVNVNEAGSSHAFSDLHKNALTMMDKFVSLAASETEVVEEGSRVKIQVINREYNR